MSLASQQRIWGLAQRVVDFPGVKEVIPGMNNLTVLLTDPQVYAARAVDQLQSWWQDSDAFEPESRLIEIPVVYGGKGDQTSRASPAIPA